MKFKTFMKVWELGKGRNQSRWMMAVFPEKNPFPFPALQNDPLTAINLATAYYRQVGFHELAAAVGNSQGISQPGSLSPGQPGHGQPQGRQGRRRLRPMPCKPSV